MAYPATWAFCSGENFKYRPREGLESCFELYSDARRADTFRLALFIEFIVCDFTVLDKGPLGSGRDVDLTEKYVSNAMIEPEHIVEHYYVQNIFASKDFANKLSRIGPNREKSEILTSRNFPAIRYYGIIMVKVWDKIIKYIRPPRIESILTILKKLGEEILKYMFCRCTSPCTRCTALAYYILIVPNKEFKKFPKSDEI